MIYDRHEDIAATTKRHPAIVRHRAVADRDGTLRLAPGHRGRDGRRRVLNADPGRAVARRAPRRRPVPLPERPDPRGRSRRTRPPNGAFRGFGAPQTIWAIERHMDRLAERLGLDPLELRRRNLMVLGDVTATGQRLSESVGGEECLRAAMEKSGYVPRRAAHDRQETGRRGSS